MISFNKKMQDVLIVYKEINEQNQNPIKHKGKKIVTVSLDEKSGIQAIANAAPICIPSRESTLA
jgi:hypothetical protein